MSMYNYTFYFHMKWPDPHQFALFKSTKESVTMSCASITTQTRFLYIKKRASDVKCHHSSASIDPATGMCL